MIYQSVLIATVFATASARVFTNEPSHQKLMWENFKRDHAKSYATMAEENTRFGYFLANLKLADERNTAEAKMGGSAVHGITPFSDLSQAEFASRFLKSDPTLRSKNAEVVEITTAVNTSSGLVDWSGIYTTPVKNQGYCGSCWAFSASEQIESDSMRTLSTSYVLSPEQIVQCDKTSFGCDGGWTEHAYNYVKTAGGISTEAAYPYTSYYGTTGTCSTSSSSSFVIGVKSYSTINGESSMASYVQKTGPLSVCLDASSWSSYTGGIMTVCGKDIDHCVQAVGVDASTGGYWKVRNSWGTSWGESGYIRLAYGSNTCGITNDPTYTTVYKV